MKKLDDIPKISPFEAPEGYFDRLPGRIQERVAANIKRPAGRPVWSAALRYALPLLIFSIAGYYFMRTPVSQSAEEILASIDSSQLVAYLDDSEVSADELLDNVELDDADALEIQQQSMTELPLSEEESQMLSDELGIEY